MPATMLVTIPVPHNGSAPDICLCTIAAQCPRCGGGRGDPISEMSWCHECGHYRCIDVWTNPCGHADPYPDVLMEVALQCAAPGCVAGWAAEHFPFCSTGCAGTDLYRRAQAASEHACALCEKARAASAAAAAAAATWLAWDQSMKET